ncbi:uncharacterized protein P174DRAFT_444445 [Aspergillus novofumigatus IBT 16806]|uniref:Uncharacterized protein n=1 Tax=Aspergillus novofumigatus (strain IBT 16806) TaxID=1392255 RepID=A0A2I1BZ71_ASPN1|nr:uncharacterized protein P174DRAFT_444445 [Aspergillus novofumigatus IBT 16806]PKX90680.1 hypothetical protein P174DRAFT_444445 [Aspergillus novofumigatus IBT 16806]
MPRTAVRKPTGSISRILVFVYSHLHDALVLSTLQPSKPSSHPALHPQLIVFYSTQRIQRITIKVADY